MNARLKSSIKRLVMAFIFLTVAVSMTSCSSPSDLSSGIGKSKNDVSIGTITDNVQQAGKEHVEVIGLNAGIDPHLY